MPRLTIAIPTLNRASLVGRAIESALAQTYPSVEILVSNNGSTDATREVLERYEGSPRLRILHRDVTIPAGEHGDALIREARGEFFLGLSDDDWLEPDFAAKVMELFDRRPDLSFVWTGCDVLYGPVVMPARTGPEAESGPDFLAAFLAGERNVCWCACVTRTADLRRLGPIPPDVVCGDMYFWTKIAATGSVGCVADRLSHYVCYREESDGHAGGTPVLVWAKDAQRWVRDILATCSTATNLPYSREELQRYADRFLSRSTGNQFVWQALRGEKRFNLLRTVRAALPFLRGRDMRTWILVMAGVLAPRWLLRQRIFAASRRRAKGSS